MSSVALTSPELNIERDLKEVAVGVSIPKQVGNNSIISNHLKVNALDSLNRGATRHMHQETVSPMKEDIGLDKSVDQKLVVRVQKGDKKAFDLLVIKYQGKVASIVSRYISDHHEISDVTQEAFIKAYRAIGKFRGDSAFYTWLYRISINCAKNYLVAKGRRPPAADVDVDDAANMANGRALKDIASPEAVLSRDQLEVVVKSAISALPEDLSVAFTLREFDGLSYDEIAEVMSCPVGTVRSRIFRARESVDIEIKALMGE